MDDDELLEIEQINRKIFLRTRAISSTSLNPDQCPISISNRNMNESSSSLMPFHSELSLETNQQSPKTASTSKYG